MESGGRDPSQRPISAEDEALKRNTDCVYFLASPLTCKKGNECEYRHSEGARVNPRDCWYWLNGNCLNPKCLFRHPPLDGFLDGQTSTASGPSPSTEGKKSTKQTIPCYYFQNGCCLKGSRCSFMHGSQPATFTTKSTPPTAMTSLQQSKPEAVNDKGVDFFGPSTKVNGFTVKASKPLSPLTHQPSEYLSQPFDQSNGVNGSQLQPVDQHMEDGREGDDSLRESSPGFDVLVEEHEDAGYFQDDEGMGMINGIDFQDDGDFDADYEFDRYGKSSQYLEERRLDASDLRCKLMMQRKVDRPRSAIVAHPHDHDDDHDDDHNHGPRGSQSQHQLPCESALTRRLQGRVKFPGSSYVDNYRSMRSERGGERRRKGRSSSPGRRSGRHRQKASKRDLRREEEEAGPLNFAGPKSLAELKNSKSSDGDPMFDRPKLMSAVLKRKREEAGEVSGQEEREKVSDLQKLENGSHEFDDDDDGDDFSRKVRVVLT